MSRAMVIDASVRDASNQNNQPAQVIGYIRELLQELHLMAPPEAGLMLPYLIDMARDEAENAEARLEVVGRQ